MSTNKKRRRAAQDNARNQRLEESAASRKRREGSERRARRVRYDESPWARRLILLPVLALFITLALEMCNRSLSPARVWAFITDQPLRFFYNMLVVLTTLTFSELFKRRRAVLCTLSVLWLILGLVQFIVVKNRTQPFCSVDILMVKDAFSLITIYFTWPQIIAMFGGGFLVVLLVIALFSRMRRRRRFNFAMSLVVFIGLVTLTFMSAALGVRGGLFPQRFDNLVDAYNDYGFAACFTFTFGQQGISRPDDYNDERVQEIVSSLDEGEGADGELVYPVFDEDDNLARPNIVFVQLESFFDVSTIEGCELTRDPTPTFNRLCSRFPSGTLYVPTIGGGTANTEFEVLTGLNLDFFGAGEYPYNTIMQQKTAESICYNLRDYGYVSTAMHNNSATFYSRNTVYRNLGFDRFVSLEYMLDPQYTALGWCKDAVLTSEVMRALTSTEDRDLVMCISVESHGKYLDTYEEKPGDIQVKALPEGIPLAPFQNFINVLPVTDDFLHKLIVELVRFDEPTIVVAYGDHLPALELENDMLTTGSVYASRYVIWNNFGGQFEAPDLQAYRLSANLLKQLGFSGGVVTKYHQAAEPDEVGEDYLSGLEVLEYDMLYGELQAMDGESPYVPTELIMGSVPITVESADAQYHRLLVTGEGFTEFSAIVANDQALQTAYIDPQHIVARVDDPAQIASFCVAQIGKDGVELSRTEAFDLTEE